MKVHELIAILHNFHPDKKIVYGNNIGGFENIYDVKSRKVYDNFNDVEIEVVALE